MSSIKSSNAPLATENKARVLVIDDEIAILQMVRALLERGPYEVTTCESAEEALRLLEQSPYDCVITDAIMPQISGYDLASFVRDKLGITEMPILMLTRKRHRQDVKLAVEVGVTDYIFKPLDEHLLLEKVETCVRKGTTGKRRASSGPTPVTSGLEAELSVECKVIRIEGTALVIRLPFAPDRKMQLRLHGKLFEESGISSPRAVFESCHKIQDEDTHPDFPWEARVTLPNSSHLEILRIKLQKAEVV